MAQLPPGKKRRYDKLYCYHCEREVSKSAFYSHYNKFFDQRTGKWEKAGFSPLPMDVVPFKFSEESSESQSEDEGHNDFYFDDSENLFLDDPTTVSYAFFFEGFMQYSAPIYCCQ